MTPERQRVVIAEACPFVRRYGKGELLWRVSGRMVYFDPLNDINAMHAALKSQTQEFRAEFDRLLHAIAEEKHLLIIEIESKDWSDCFISCLQSQRDSGNSTP